LNVTNALVSLFIYCHSLTLSLTQCDQEINKKIYSLFFVLAGEGNFDGIEIKKTEEKNKG